MTDFTPYAVSSDNSRGRRVFENAPSDRSEFQRDRDRIIHSTAFRRLEYKTQVFLNHQGDLYRTRLTHSLEVAQVGRSVARALGLNEDLVETLALAHDLGHTPFGHDGQDALNACMRRHGSDFEHNLQSLRIVDVLEQRYAAFDGLNLLFETREGILKHCSLRNAQLLGDVGERFLSKASPTLEAQVTDLADAIAYTNHDVDDGLRSGFISVEQLKTLPMFGRSWSDTVSEYPDIHPRRQVHETVRRMIGSVVHDLLYTSRNNIAEAGIRSLEDVQRSPTLITLSPVAMAEHLELKKFLFQNLYRNPEVVEERKAVQELLSGLFDLYAAEPSLMPADDFSRYQKEGVRAVSDYVSGMTDRFAIQEHDRLFGQKLMQNFKER